MYFSVNRRTWQVTDSRDSLVGRVSGSPVTPVGRGEWELQGCGNNGTSNLKMTQVRKGFFC